MAHPHIHAHHSINPDDSVSEELRKKVYEMLADAMITGLEMLNPDIFNVKDSEVSAELIATTLDQIKTKHELLLFLKKLSDRWEVYRPVYLEFVPVHMALDSDDLQRAFARGDHDVLRHAGIIVEWKSNKGESMEHISIEEAMKRLKEMSSDSK